MSIQDKQEQQLMKDLTELSVLELKRTAESSMYMFQGIESEYSQVVYAVKLVLKDAFNPEEIKKIINIKYESAKVEKKNTDNGDKKKMPTTKAIKDYIADQIDFPIKVVYDPKFPDYEATKKVAIITNTETKTIVTKMCKLDSTINSDLTYFINNEKNALEAIEKMHSELFASGELLKEQKTWYILHLSDLLSQRLEYLVINRNDIDMISLTKATNKYNYNYIDVSEWEDKTIDPLKDLPYTYEIFTRIEHKEYVMAWLYAVMSGNIPDQWCWIKGDGGDTKTMLGSIISGLISPGETSSLGFTSNKYPGNNDRFNAELTDIALVHLDDIKDPKGPKMPSGSFFHTVGGSGAQRSEGKGKDAKQMRSNYTILCTQNYLPVVNFQNASEKRRALITTIKKYDFRSEEYQKLGLKRLGKNEVEPTIISESIPFILYCKTFYEKHFDKYDLCVKCSEEYWEDIIDSTQSPGDRAFEKLEGSLFRKSSIAGNNQIEYTSSDLTEHYNAYKATFKNAANFYGETKFLNLVKDLDYVETKRVRRVNPISGKTTRPTVYTGLQMNLCFIRISEMRNRVFGEDDSAIAIWDNGSGTQKNKAVNKNPLSHLNKSEKTNTADKMGDWE